MKTILKIAAICAICAATLMSGCMDPDTSQDAEQNMVNNSHLLAFSVDMQHITVDYVDAIDSAREECERSYDVAFVEWDTNTDELLQSTEASKDDLWTEYVSTDMTYETYDAKWDAIDNKGSRRFDLYGKELDRAQEDAYQTYLDTKDELTAEYEDSVAELATEVTG